MIDRRPDGYHELETIFLALPWGDRVTVEPRVESGIGARIEGDATGVPDDDTNLAVRAAAAYQAAAGSAFDGGLDIVLEKRIPPGAGLGGGSSDAGTVLRLLDETYGLVGSDQLGRIAAELGADVPFFLHGIPLAAGRGRGDVIEALPGVPPPQVVLILPGTVHRTARVFEQVSSPGRSGRFEAMRLALLSGEPSRIRRAHHNALRGPSVRAYPEFGVLLAEVEERLGRRPCVTGTGSTLYDLPNAGETDDVRSRLEGLDARWLLV